MSTSEHTSAPLWPEPVGILGAGAVGVALAQALMMHGVPLVGVGTRDPSQAETRLDPALVSTPAAVVAMAQLVFLTVPDSAILAAAGRYSWRHEQWVAHCAGAQPALYLAAAIAPAQPAAFHPLAAFARRQPATSTHANPFAGKIIAVDGDVAVNAGLAALATRLGGHPLVVPATARAGYHLAASLASNALVALVSQAVAVWGAAGLDAQLALPALVPLIASTQSNLAQVGLPDALTGPITRGDITTVTRHLAVFANTPALAPVAIVYRALGLQAVTLARAQGRANAAALDEIARLLQEGQS